MQDFKLGGALKKIASSGGRRETFWGISCEISRFNANKYFFSILGGGAGCVPLDPPLISRDPGGSMSWVVGSNNLYKPITTTINYKKGCTRLAAASDKVYQLFSQGRWSSPASSTTKSGRHDTAEIMLKVALNTRIHSFYTD